MPTFIDQSKTDLYLTGDIGFEISAKNFIADLHNTNTPQLVVHIDSLGGNVFDGISIYNALRDYTGKKTAIIEGICASAASYILMAFDEVIAKPNSLLMIHNPLVENVSGNANELSKITNTLTELSNIYISAYAERTHLPEAEIKTLMDNETYFGAIEAKQKGFVDFIDGEQDISTDALIANAKLRFVAYSKTLKPKPFINMTDKDTDISPKEPTATEQEQQEEKPVIVKEAKKEESIFSVEEAQAIFDEAKEIDTQQAYKLAKEQIETSIKDPDDKSAFEEILTALTNLIKPEEDNNNNTSPEESATQQQEEEEEEASDTEESVVIEDPFLIEEKKRKQSIKAFADEVNEDGSLNELLIEALLNEEMTLEDFKSEACKRLVKARAVRNYKAVLFADKQNKPQSNNPNTFKTKKDYVAHYRRLIEDGDIVGASAFYRKYSNIF